MLQLFPVTGCLSFACFTCVMKRRQQYKHVQQNKLQTDSRHIHQRVCSNPRKIIFGQLKIRTQLDLAAKGKTCQFIKNYLTGSKSQNYQLQFTMSEIVRPCRSYLCNRRRKCKNINKNLPLYNYRITSFIFCMCHFLVRCIFSSFEQYRQLHLTFNCSKSIAV